MAEIEKMNLESLDIVDERLERMRELFPEVFSESGLDFEKLRIELGDEIDDGDERYAFTWPGKRDAIRQAQTTSTATLRPRVDQSFGRDGKSQGFDSSNLYIEGDNLEVLKLLLSAYHGQIQFIYIDPPYNTEKDFIYRDTFSDSIQSYKEQTGLINQSNPDYSGKRHSKWCTLLYPRLRVARELLKDTGVIAISIDDIELSGLLRLVSEIFGEGNILSVIPRVTKKAGKSSDALAKNHDYIILAAKSSSVELYPPKQTNTDDYPNIDEYVDERGPYKLNQCLDYDSLQYSASLDYPIEIDGETLYPGGSYEAYRARKDGNHARADWAWRWSKDKFAFGLKNGFVVVKHGRDRTRIYTKTYLNATIEDDPSSTEKYKVEIAPRTVSISTLEFTDNRYSNDNASKGLAALFGIKGIFDYSKPVSLLRSLIAFCTKESDIVLDFFSGSATAAHATMLQNYADSASRRFIMVQLPELLEQGSVAKRSGFNNLCELGRKRIELAGIAIRQKSEDGNTLFSDDSSRQLDTGFRAFVLDESGIDTPRPGELRLNVIKSDRSDLDIVFEMMLKWGLELTLPVDQEMIAGYPCYSVACGELICCLAPGLTIDVLETIAEIEPRRVFVLDSILDDSLKLNAVQIFKRIEERIGREVELRTV